MRVKIEYEKEQKESLFKPIPDKFKIKLNKMPVMDFSFDKPAAIFLEAAQINKDKKNLIRFRKVAMGEKEEKKRVLIANIFRGILFVLMAIILPFAFMRFKKANTSFAKLKFEYSETHDFVLIMSPTGFAYRFDAINSN